MVGAQFVKAAVDYLGGESPGSSTEEEDERPHPGVPRPLATTTGDVRGAVRQLGSAPGGLRSPASS